LRGKRRGQKQLKAESSQLIGGASCRAELEARSELDDTAFERKGQAHYL